MPVTRRRFLHGVGMAGAAIRVGLPPLAAWFTTNGTAYAATAKPVAPRFVFWFNGNGIPERYWIPSEEGSGYRMTPCLSPLAPFRSDVHVLSGLDNAASGGQGNGHTNSMSGLMTGTRFTGRGPSGPSIDQVIASKLGGDSRFRSLQIGVSQESFGESMQRNMSWAGYERALPPEMIPHRLFDRLFGDHQFAGDPGVAVPLGHQRQDLQPPRSERRDRIVPTRPPDHAGHHVGINDGPTRRDPRQCLHEVLDIQHPLLEQVANSL